MEWRSKNILKAPEWAKNRALYKSMGYTDYDLEKPLIAVANSWNRVVPGHFNLRLVSEYVRQGIFQAGGTPVEFNTIAACDGIANGHKGMHYILPTRDLIANDIEMMIEAHQFDGVVLLGSCDKIVPGMLMAAARLDLPAIMVVGGPMAGGRFVSGRRADTTSLVERLGMIKKEEMDVGCLRSLENDVAPTWGSCSFLGTANTMCCLTEALGIALPGSATIPAYFSERLRVAQESGRQIVDLIKRGVKTSMILTRQSLENAIRVNAAIGGSTNAALHIPAIAYEAGIDITMEEFGYLSKSTPYIAKMNPAAAPNINDFHDAGGVQAVIQQIRFLLNEDAITVNGKTIGENCCSKKIVGKQVIRSAEDPWEREGGIAVLKGNLAPNTAITKPIAISHRIRVFTGKAKCFDSEESAIEAIMNGKIEKGAVVTIRYEGPKGGPGMREMYKAMKVLCGLGLSEEIAVITDGRFSGTNNGCFVGHISPEAAEGGPLAVVRDGDSITIDIPNSVLELHVSENEMNSRFEKWKKPSPKVNKGYLALYSRLAESADKGAVIRNRF